MNYFQTHWIELVGAVLSLIYLYLSIKAKVSLWFFGIISSLFYIVIFFDAKLYADLSLNLYYVVISIYGWINWHRTTASNAEQLTTARLTPKLLVQLTAATVIFYVLYFVILSRFTDSNVPRIDALVGALSVTGTWMLAKKLLENWLVWIVVDAICIGLYLYKNLYPTAILFIIYTIMAGLGYWQWKKNASKTH